MPEVKFLQQNLDDPTLYLGELQGNSKGRQQPAVYIIPSDPEPVRRSDDHGDPFRTPSPIHLDPAQWNRGPRSPDPIRSKKAAIVKPTTSVSQKPGNRVTIRSLTYKLSSISYA